MKALVAIDRTSKFVVVELVERADMQAAAAFRFRYASKLASRVPNKTFARRINIHAAIRSDCELRTQSSW